MKFLYLEKQRNYNPVALLVHLNCTGRLQDSLFSIEIQNDAISAVQQKRHAQVQFLSAQNLEFAQY